MSAERLLALLETPPAEPLPPDVRLWLRCGLERAVLNREPVAQALGLAGERGRADALAEVRFELRRRALLELGESLVPAGSIYAQTVAIAEARSGGRELTEHQGDLLELAARTAGIPADPRNLREILRACETPISNPVPDQRDAG
ncbi:hypothetical protein KBTX_01685 [wastewater metagenome]|uniref:Uncharacterized protein n=2 Tax=unclassified sequences TaxID=12908 RepID=A0A5B8RCZ8_9ZZZZ|nr:hypothetical protein [Arhodomonas sp. KWT]QEA05364.1 hypothetical protein KBTEX_01685 [uncultured organism]